MSGFLLDWPAGHRTRIDPVMQGEFKVCSDTDVTLSTVLGSCVSICFYDLTAKVGGMNHYLLVGQNVSGEKNLKYGAHSIELLINGLLRAGADRRRLEAKVYGGSLMSGRFDHIGPENSEFALNYLDSEGFKIAVHDVGGTAARRINFHPSTGQVRVNHTAERVETKPSAMVSNTAPKEKPAASVLF